MRISHTARYMALFRALETARPHDRLFSDPYASRFLTPGLRLATRSARVPTFGRALDRFIDARWPGARSSGVARTRLIDDWVGEAIAAGIDQVVILGAGFDCRAYRLPSLAAVPVFEVDRPALLANKRARLGSAVAKSRGNVIDVPIDFLRDDLGSRLANVGMRIGTRMLFLWEGVTNYLDAFSVARVFDLVARTGAPGTRIAFTYVDAAVFDTGFDAPGLAAVRAKLEASGEWWTFGFRPEDLRSYLAARGLLLVSDRGAAEYRPLIMKDRARDLVGYEFYRVALAQLDGAQAGLNRVTRKGAI